ncbi:MAG: hypothetical protein IJA67_10585 [Oscillospiraceae bacterium]|nr:hypothetical protein [Oscillospiraceae bacterium]
MTVIRLICFMLIYLGVAEIWEAAEITLYGFSQASAVDAMACFIWSLHLTGKWEESYEQTP